MGGLVFNGVNSLASAELVPVFWGSFAGATDPDVVAMLSYLDGLAGYLSGADDPINQAPTVSQYGVTGASVADPFFPPVYNPLWSAWAEFPEATPTQPATQLATGVDSAGNLNIFAVTASGVVRSSPLGAGWTAWDAAAPGPAPAGATIQSIRLSSNQDGHLEIFGIDGGGNIYHAWETGGTWKTWTTMMTGTNGNVFRSVSTVVNPNGCMTLFALTPQGNILCISQTQPSNSSSWGAGWGELSIDIDPMWTATAIAAAINPAQLIQIVALDQTGVLWFTWSPLENSVAGFVPWTQLLGPSGPAPLPLASFVMGTNEDGHLEVLAIDSFNNLNNIWQVSTAGVPIGSSWSDWNGIASSAQTQFATGAHLMQVITNPANNALELFCSDSNGALWRIFQQTPSVSTSWGVDVTVPPQWGCLGTVVGTYAATATADSMFVCCVDNLEFDLWTTSLQGEDWVADFAIPQTIGMWQGLSAVPPQNSNQVLLLFMKDIPLANYPVAGWGGYHEFDPAYSNLYAVVPLHRPLLGEYPPFVQAGQNATPQYQWQAVVCHEILESLTDPRPWNGWVMPPQNCEGADLCAGSAPCSSVAFPLDNLSFGPVVGFWDNSQMMCSVFTPTTGAHHHHRRPRRHRPPA